MSLTLTEVTKWHKYKGYHLRGTVKMLDDNHCKTKIH
jgi:hypothetical protein